MSPAIHQAMVIAAALRFYSRTGYKANRAYTPSNMMKMATKITGQSFKPRAYEDAADALSDWVKEMTQ